MPDKWLRWENGRIKPILFNTEMVQAIMDGRKTVTRRVVKQRNLTVLDSPYHREHQETPDKVLLEKLCLSPYQPGDILYVRETWAAWSRTEGTVPEIHYKADGETLPDVKWRPSIHMPREAARLFLRVKDVRVERLRPMGLDEFEEEGFSTIAGLWDTTAMFADLWDSTIKKSEIPIYGWNANPWVWVIEFERISREEAAE